MKQKKKIIIIGIVILISILIFFPFRRNQSSSEYNWNGGYCIEDGGRLNYMGTSNKVHYQCEKCGKNYYFDGVMTYNKKEK